MPQLIRRDGDDPNNPYRKGQMHPETGRPICGAKHTQNEELCMQRPMANGRCLYHGGKSLGGMAHPNFIDGRHSKYIATELLETYREGLNDPQLRELGPEIALLDTRIKILTSRVSDGENNSWWKDIQKIWGHFMDATQAGDLKEQNKLLLLLNSIIVSGSDENKAWLDIATLIDQRRKLVDTEQRRLVQAQQMITVEQAMLMLQATIASLREVVYLYAEPKIAQLILSASQTKYNAIVSYKPPHQPDDRTVDGSGE